MVDLIIMPGKLSDREQEKRKVLFFFKEKAEHQELMPLNCGAREDSRESLGLQGDQTSPKGNQS